MALGRFCYFSAHHSQSIPLIFECSLFSRTTHNLLAVYRIFVSPVVEQYSPITVAESDE